MRHEGVVRSRKDSILAPCFACPAPCSEALCVEQLEVTKQQLGSSPPQNKMLVQLLKILILLGV